MSVPAVGGGRHSGSVRPRRRTDPKLKVIAPGLEIPLSPGAAPDDEPVAFRLGRQLRSLVFNACPVCLAADAVMSAEHVPPAVVGGTRMTRTCLDCNNGFAPAERALADHRDRTLRDVRFTSDVVPGKRRTAKAMLRYADDGKFALFLMGADPAIRDGLADGSISMTYSIPGESHEVV